MKKRIAKVILFVFVFLGLYNIGINAKRVLDCKIDINKENVMQRVEFVGDVPEGTKEWCERILQNEISDETINYLINSGGKIVLVYTESHDVTEYINEAYGFTRIDTEEYLEGIAIPYKDCFGNLIKIDVVVHCHGVGVMNLGHEMGHVYDISHGYVSKQSEFVEEIYNNREAVSKKVLSQAIANRNYYESTPTEYFAELYKRYCKGVFKRGYNEEMDMVIDYFESLEL